MESKFDKRETWPVVEFIMAATGFRTKEAREFLDQVPRERYSRLFIEAKAWERDAKSRASTSLSAIIGDVSIAMFEAATEFSRHPGGVEAAPSKKSLKKKK